MAKQNFETKYYIRFFTFLVFSLFIFIFRIKKKLPRKIKKLKPPYLVLSNHVGTFDPFIAGHFLPHFTHFVSSDAVLRSKLVRFFLTRLGVIPKKKNIRDTKVIRDIISVINSGECVGIFPEAVRNWSGTSFPIEKSIVKLIKMLNVPVVVPILKGMNLFNPRWSKRLRYTKVEVEYNLLLNETETKILADDEIYKRLLETLKHDEVEYQRKHKNKIYSSHKAEHISHTLYVCPECKSIDSFKCAGNSFFCTNCNYDIHINKYGFFERKTEGKLFFDNIRDWYDWEENWLMKFVSDRFDENSNEVIFEDKKSKIYHSYEKDNLNFIDIADVKLFINRIVIDYVNKTEIISLDFDTLQTINPQLQERLEIFYNNEAYRIIGTQPGVSALKWEVAVNAIWKKAGQINKLSPYIKSSEVDIALELA
ncbi:MAG: 1-acyl-sn-glycerol-3-phosphate acyltransferase [Chlorobi bacterium]|nr:1-acyl-sn-glycerol-3-phosphate acyltransferase [Chlorobiota bacterium]